MRKIASIFLRILCLFGLALLIVLPVQIAFQYAGLRSSTCGFHSISFPSALNPSLQMYKCPLQTVLSADEVPLTMPMKGEGLSGKVRSYVSVAIHGTFEKVSLERFWDYGWKYKWDRKEEFVCMNLDGLSSTTPREKAPNAEHYCDLIYPAGLFDEK